MNNSQKNTTRFTLATVSRTVAVVVTAAGIACTAEPRAPGTGISPSAIDAARDPLRVPTVETPLSTPLDAITIRGQAPDAVRVFLRHEGQAGGQSFRVNGDSYCGQIKLGKSGQGKVEIISMAEDGRLSEPAVISVSFDATSQAVDPCSLALAAAPPVEDCENPGDDDQNGVSDACEQECNNCIDDRFEPNDGPQTVPSITKGSHPLSLCPCQEDWFSFNLTANERVNISATFSTANLNLDLFLFRADDAVGQDRRSVDSSSGDTGRETISWCDAEPDVYYLQVKHWAGVTNKEGNYTLNVASTNLSTCPVVRP